jgi:tetratricopeptide (TPR) repeat protein
MMSFYDRKGIDSWSQGVVPHFITCNAFIGRSYAKVLQGFLRDCAVSGRMKLDRNEPLYIIELGVGSGKFSFYMIKALFEMAATLDFPVEKLVYVMTDFTDENVKFWREHPQLKQYFDSGQMDCANFDAVSDRQIHLIHSNVTLEVGSVKNPLCIVANYLFDTLCHDIFQVHPAPLGSSGDKGVLKEGLVSVGSKQAEEPDPLDPEIIKRLDNHYLYKEITDKYYDTKEDSDHEHLQRILAWYQHSYSGLGAADSPTSDRTGASLLIPIGALRALNRLTSLSKGRVLVISGDKGNNNPEFFRGLIDPHIAVHGSFSVMVNYHAIGMYFTSRGGFALHNPQEEASLKVSAFVLPGDESLDDDDADTHSSGWTGDSVEKRDRSRLEKFPFLHEAFYNHVESFGPNDFFVMQKALKEDSPTPTLKAVVALLKLGDWDPDVFHKFRDTILNQIPTYGNKLRNDLMRGIPRVWLNHYTLDKDKDVAFEIGRFYYGVRDFTNALLFYALSDETVGPHHVTSHNMGLCKYSLKLFPEAKAYFEQSLALNKDYAKAATWLGKVNDELANPTPELEVKKEERALVVDDDSSSDDT